MELHNHALKVLPPNSLVLPGTEFGPIVGNASGTFGDFVWLNLWTLFMREEAVEQLRAEDIKLPTTVPVQLKYKLDEQLNISELNILPSVRFDPTAFMSISRRCGKCGRLDTKLEKIIVEKATVPDDQDLMRGYEFPTIILATEKFRTSVERLGLIDIAFEEVEAI